jgi:hypothetical protein
MEVVERLLEECREHREEMIRMRLTMTTCV